MRRDPLRPLVTFILVALAILWAMGCTTQAQIQAEWNAYNSCRAKIDREEFKLRVRSLEFFIEHGGHFTDDTWESMRQASYLRMKQRQDTECPPQPTEFVREPCPSCYPPVVLLLH